MGERRTFYLTLSLLMNQYRNLLASFLRQERKHGIAKMYVCLCKMPAYRKDITTAQAKALIAEAQNKMAQIKGSKNKE